VTSSPRSSRIDSTIEYSKAVSPGGGDSVPSTVSGEMRVFSRCSAASS